MHGWMDASGISVMVRSMICPNSNTKPKLSPVHPLQPTSRFSAGPMGAWSVMLVGNVGAKGGGARDQGEGLVFVCVVGSPVASSVFSFLEASLDHHGASRVAGV